MTELELPKILVSRLPQHNSNVNTEYARKSGWSKQSCYLYVTSFLEHWHILISFILILICFSLVMSRATDEIYGSFSAKTTPGVSLCWSLTLEENIIAVITQHMVIDENLKRQIKNQTLCTCRLFLLTYIFQHNFNWLKVF